MMNISKTESGTLIVNGIEYNAYPPPGKLIKVMKRCRAEEFISQGTMRFGNLEEYRKWENKILGDENDGNGMYAMNGHQYNTGSANEVFAWCTSLPEISNKRIWEIAKSNDYDCIIEINSPLELFRRISKYLGGEYKGDFILHCGHVSYDRGSEVDRATLNNQQFHFNVFQKGTHFQNDKEYRLSITNYSLEKKYGKCVFVTIGDCHDIIQLKDLPHPESWGMKMKNIILSLFQKYFISKLRKISVINFSIFMILLFLITFHAKAFAQNRCETDDRGHAFCAPLGGSAVKNIRGEVLCAPGDCIVNNLGYIKCSAEKGGGVSADNLGRVSCMGGCIDPSKSFCQELTKE